MRGFITYTLRATILAATLLLGWSCNHSVKFDINGHLLENAAHRVYLVVEGATIDTLASATVHADNTFHLQGEVAEPTTAFICDDNGNALTILLIEDQPLQLHPLPTGGYIAEGGPINDKYNLIIQRLSDVAQQIAELDASSPEAGEAYESLMFRYHNILSTAISDNLDNIIGVELFLSQEARGMSANDMRVRMAQFSPKMQSLSAMQQFAEYVDIYARTETGNKFTELELQTITGDKISLSEICNKGNWVLLDFWATWCEPCCREIPTLREAYAKYAVQGFEICGVSLDRDALRWQEFIQRNEMLWINAMDAPDKSGLSAAEIYGLQSIPANFLISPDGTIVARNLQGEALMHELEHVFDECACTDEISGNQ